MTTYYGLGEEGRANIFIGGGWGEAGLTASVYLGLCLARDYRDHKTNTLCMLLLLLYVYALICEVFVYRLYNVCLLNSLGTLCDKLSV